MLDYKYPIGTGKLTKYPSFAKIHIVVVVQLLSHVRLFATPWTAAPQASLSFTISWSLRKLMSIESEMPSNHLVLCRLLLLPSIFPSTGVFSNESDVKWYGQKKRKKTQRIPSTFFRKIKRER